MIQTEKIYQKVLKGTLQGVSVGYDISRYEELIDSDSKSSNGRFTGPAYVITDWEPLEISIVSVPVRMNAGGVLNTCKSSEALLRISSD